MLNLTTAQKSNHRNFCNENYKQTKYVIIVCISIVLNIEQKMVFGLQKDAPRIKVVTVGWGGVTIRSIFPYIRIFFVGTHVHKQNVLSCSGALLALNH